MPRRDCLEILPDLRGPSLYYIKKAIFHAGCCCFALCLGPAWSPKPPLGSRSCKLHLLHIARLLYLTARPPTKTAMLLGAAAHQPDAASPTLPYNQINKNCSIRPQYLTLCTAVGWCVRYTFDLIWFDLIFVRRLYIFRHYGGMLSLCYNF